MNNNNKAINNNEKLGELSNKDFSKRVENLDIDKVMANTIEQAQTLLILFLMLLNSTNIILV